MQQLRIARPTDRLEAIVAQYRSGLELELLGSFADHEGFDGAMLGEPEAGWHLEFTREQGVPAGGSPSAEHLLVSYVEDADDWRRRCARMSDAGFREVEAHNPYWSRCGRTFEDLDGYRVVIVQGRWR